MTGPAAWLEGLLKATGSAPIGRTWQCPAHTDPTPSLSIADGRGGRALIICRAGCSTRDVLAALHVNLPQLFEAPAMPPDRYARMTGLAITYPPVVHPTGPRTDPSWRYEAAHQYGDRWRLLRFRHPSGRKALSWETLDSAGAWIPGLRGIPTRGLPLYRDKEVGMAVAAAEPLHLVESESSADAYAATGRYATTWAGGASSPPLDILAATLTGGHIVLVPDNDPPGLACADRIRVALEPVAATLNLVLPDPGQDARDLLNHDPARLTAART